MALKKEITTSHGLHLPNAYHKITYLRLQVPNDLLIQVTTYISAEDRENRKDPLQSKAHSFQTIEMPQGNNLLEMAYILIKSLPEYSGGLDC